MSAVRLNKRTRSDIPSLLVHALLVAAAVWGLWDCLPGFRPKHLRDMLKGLFVVKGPAIGVYLLAMALLVPPMERLFRKGWGLATRTGTLVGLLGGLLGIELLFEVVAPAASAWATRAVVAGMFGWGLADRKLIRAASGDLRHKIKNLWVELPSFRWKLLFVLVSFFFLRQDLLLYLFRETPFGDEVSWWFTGARDILNHGISWTVANHSYGYYQPGIAWLIAFPAKLFGLTNEAYLWGFQFFVFGLFFVLMAELAATAFAFLGGMIVLFYVFLSSRDLLHMFGGFFYGETIASVLVGTIGAELYFAKRQVAPLQKVIVQAAFVAFVLLSKPPVSVFAPVVLLAFVALQSTRKTWWVLPLSFGVSYLPQMLWKTLLVQHGKVAEYTVSFAKLQETGVQIEGALSIIRGLFIAPSFQFAFFSGCVLAMIITALCRKWRLLGVMGILMGAYWGFVLTLYSTFWAQGDFTSAGRYMSHSAIAVVLLLPLALNGRRRNV